MFISSHTLHQLLNDDTQETVTDELIHFIVDLLNFYKEFSSNKNERCDKVPDKIIFKPKNNENKLNALLLLISSISNEAVDDFDKKDNDKSSDGHYSHQLSLLTIVW